MSICKLSVDQRELPYLGNLECPDFCGAYLAQFTQAALYEILQKQQAQHLCLRVTLVPLHACLHVPTVAQHDAGPGAAAVAVAWGFPTAPSHAVDCFLAYLNLMPCAAKYIASEPGIVSHHIPSIGIH